VKLNIGCGDYPLSGYVNLDLMEPADVVEDFWWYSVPHDFYEEIRADHWLEHIPTADVKHALTRMHAWLASGGALHIEVPDLTKICAGITGPVGLVQALYGSQQHEGEFHKTGFTTTTLAEVIAAAGFAKVEVTAFISDHPARSGYPCLLAKAVK
jgi:predicted SAM-dependent methyltransferase